jgi:hypothetical protein
MRQPIPPFWIAVQIGIIICVLISAVIVIVKLLAPVRRPLSTAAGKAL